MQHNLIQNTNLQDYRSQLKVLCNSLYNAIYMPVSVYDKDNQIIFTLSADSNPSILSFANKVTLLNQSSFSADNHTAPFEIQNNIKQKFIVKIVNQQKIVIGPYYIKIQNECKNGIRIIDKDTRDLISRFVDFTFNNLPNLSSYNNISSDTKNNITDQYFTIEKYIPNDLYKNYPIQLEYEFMSAIKNCDYENALKLVSKLKVKEYKFHMGNIRKIKNSTIIGISSLGRIAIEKGLTPDIAIYINQMNYEKIESAHTENDLYELYKTLLKQYINIYRQLKIQKYSLYVNRSIQYIQTHIYINLTLIDVSEQVGVSSKYLSKLFKAETSYTLNQYIHEEKIKEAKKLLENSNKKIVEISELLNFKSQSYFNYIFKNSTGVSPSEFKQGILTHPTNTSLN